METKELVLEQEVPRLRENLKLFSHKREKRLQIAIQKPWKHFNQEIYCNRYSWNRACCWAVAADIYENPQRTKNPGTHVSSTRGTVFRYIPNAHKLQFAGRKPLSFSILRNSRWSA